MRRHLLSPSSLSYSLSLHPFLRPDPLPNLHQRLPQIILPPLLPTRQPHPLRLLRLKPNTPHSIPRRRLNKLAIPRRQQQLFQTHFFYIPALPLLRPAPIEHGRRIHKPIAPRRPSLSELQHVSLHHDAPLHAVLLVIAEAADLLAQRLVRARIRAGQDRGGGRVVVERQGLVVHHVLLCADEVVG